MVLQMKTCVSSYSYGKYISDEHLGIFGMIEHAAKCGFDGIEFLEGGWQNEHGIPEKIREHCEKCGITPVAYLIGADLLNNGSKDGKEEIARVEQLVDVAARLGVKLVRHDVCSGVYGRKYQRGYDDVLPILADRASEITKYAQQKGIRTMTENHGQFSQDAYRVEKLINAVAHPNFGALVDIGNFLCADENPNISVGIMAPYAFHVHAKDFFVKSGLEVNPGEGWFLSRAGNYLRGTIIGHGNAGVVQSIRTIVNSGYDDYITVEFEGMEGHIQGIELGLKNLKKFIAMAKN